MNSEEEIYLHYFVCVKALNDAWVILKTIRENPEGGHLVSPAFSFALIEYAKPYKESRGNVKWRNALDATHVPSDMLPLHQELLDWRDQVLAHTDMTILNAAILAKSQPHSGVALISSNIIDPTKHLARIDEIISLVEKTLDSMYARVPPIGTP